MFEILMLGAAVGGTGAGYVGVRRFVRERLRFVDGVQLRGVPVAVGIAATLAATPVVWLLPVVGAGTAILFGAGVGLAVSHGARDVRSRSNLLPGSF